MESITGIPQNIDSLEVKKLGDILYFEGPLLSHVQLGGDEFLMKWVDHDEESNRWMLKKVNENILWAYFNKQISLKDIFTISSPKEILFLDLSHELEIISAVLSEVKDIPESYLPENGSLFDAEHQEPYAIDLAEGIVKPFI